MYFMYIDVKKELYLLCDRVHYHHVSRSIPRHYAAAGRGVRRCGERILL